jgi:hypothetical protein
LDFVHFIENNVLQYQSRYQNTIDAFLKENMLSRVGYRFLLQFWAPATSNMTTTSVPSLPCINSNHAHVVAKMGK